MPFTPFHLGLGLGLGLPLRRYIHAPTFILANIVIDVEPFLVLFFRLKYPLHGYLHTFLFAMLVGLAFGYLMLLLEGFLHSLYKVLLLEASVSLSPRSFVAAGVLGTVLHVLLDSPLYEDIKPLYPIAVNPLYNPSLVIGVYCLCIWVGVFGAMYYLGLMGLIIYRRFLKRKNH